MKQCRNFKTVIIALFMVFPLFAGAQHKLSGTVISETDGVLLQDANVQLLNTKHGDATNDQGQFVLNNVKSGNYTLKVSFVGYNDYKQTIRITSDQRITIKLSPSMIMQEEVIISAIRAKETQASTYTNLNKKKIESENQGQDLPFIMSRTPSMVVTSDAGAGIGYTGMRIRGTDITRINVTVNGIPINDPESHGVFWVNMPDLATSIDHIQIQRGVGTSTNGQAAFGASINIQTTGLREKAYMESSTIFGSFNTLKNALSFGTGLINNKFAIDARLSKMNSDGFIDRAWSDLKSFYVSAGYYGKKSITKLNIFSGKEHTYQAWGGVPKDKLETDRTYNPYTYENETDNYQQDHYQLTYSNQLMDKLLLNLAGHYTRGRGYYEQFKEGRSFEDYQLPNFVIGDSTITETDLIQQKWLDNHFFGTTYSLNYEDDRVNIIAGGSWNKYIGDHFGEVIWMDYTSTADKNYEWYRNQGIKTDFNVYGKMNYHLTNALSLYGDLQYRQIFYDIDGIHDDLRDLTQEHTYKFVNPKAGVHYKLDDRQNVYLSFAIGNREPSRSAFRDADDDKMPRPERLMDYEAGYVFRNNMLSVAANAFYMDYKDQLILTGEINDVGAAMMTNAPKSFRTGIELSFGMKPVTFFEMNTNIAYSVNKIKDFTAYVDDWDHWGEQIIENLGEVDIAFSPAIVADNEFKFTPFNNFNVSLISKYVSDQYIDNTMNEERKLDAYFVNDVRFEYAIKDVFFKEIKLSLALNNVLNHEYETNAWVYRYYTGGEYGAFYGYYPQAGFNFLAGLNIKL